ncbi:AMP-binding protein, partial [Actinoalloteichus spitiensis]|uniref:AMP-binding protein n=1 Tax=Actinoalloteichus spitiensis TaxID=252394 RepID=UPI00247AD073
MVYTSGSTGRPKGVVVSQQAIVAHLDWMVRTFPLGTGDRVLHKTSIGFDVSVWELAWPVITGAGVVLARPGGQRDPAYLAGVIERVGVTVTHFVPSMLAAFVAEDGVARCGGLRWVLCSGEALPPGVVDRWARRVPGVPVVNLYGPTEAAIDVTWWPCPTPDGRSPEGGDRDPGTGDPSSASVPIGRPVDNTGVL